MELFCAVHGCVNRPTVTVKRAERTIRVCRKCADELTVLWGYKEIR